ncbi:TonB-dependent receptor [Rhizorhabdus wittichii]|uniref:TonB-dependent receptor n=1 Tax=Rhizorhabdus wittichii TaxID=160791 RepID=UPI0002EB4647|nr:TonB-dependent receptor [Rhizorhabdus wittichii]
MTSQRRRAFRRGLTLSAALIGIIAVPVHAQAADDAVAEGEIVVTANKRTQALKDVGVTAAVLGAQQLTERKIVSLADIAATVPGLSYSSSENNTPVFTLRGVGFNEASLAAYPTVSVYTDEAPLPFPVLSAQGAFDLDRIEVLKGPQGTLFGQNSTGGAINYIAAKPTDTLSAGADLSYGRFDMVEANGFVSGPLGEQLKFRVAGHYLHADDWQKSYTRKDSLGESEVYAVRGLLDWEPADTVKFSLMLNAWQDKSDPQAGQLVAVYPQIAAAAYPEVVNYPYPPQNARAADWSNGTTVSPTGSILDPRPRSNRKFQQAVLRGDIDLTDQVTLTSLSSYLHFRQRQSQDYDGTASNNDDIPFNDGTIKSVFQELRLSNGGRSSIRWGLGANYQRSRIRENDGISYSTGSTSNAGLNFIIQNGYRSNTLRRDYAFFGNAEVDVAPGLTLKAGARYTNSLTGVNLCNTDLGDGRTAALISGLSALLTGGPAPVVRPGIDCVTLNSSFQVGQPFIDSLKQHNTSWRFGVDYKLNRDVLLYANVSRSYKAGSYPTISASSEAQYIPVTQESVTAYEAGAKLTTADRTFTTNVAAFYYDYRNKQIRGKTLDPIFGVLNALINVPKSRLYGAEIEAGVRPFRGLALGASVTYVNSKVQRYTGTNVLGVQQDFAGSSIPFSPKWQAQVDGEYRWDMGGVTPFVGAVLNVRAKTIAYIGGSDLTIPASPVNSMAPGVTRPFAIKGYQTVDLRAGAEWGQWKAMIWGKNVFDTYYWQNVISAFDTVYRLAGRPASYGVTVGYKF